MEKNKAVIIRNAVAVKEYALLEEPNPKYRNYMEDSNSMMIQRQISMTAFLKAAQNLYYSVFTTDMEGISLVNIYKNTYHSQ